ncbi:MAG TPA: DEAD/DEAH box helicase [Actinomycetota bacterium]
MSLDAFSPAARAWFESTFAAPTKAQSLGWEAIAGGEHALICAPTGSGKTLAAFLWALDRMATEPVPDKTSRMRVLYISPLRALAVDIEKNLRAPLSGMALAAERLGERIHVPEAAVRTGDTSSRERAAILRAPPDILITTPESLYLMLTSQARETLRSVRWVIVDEIHALAPVKRGAHLALSLERLEQITGAPPQRIGLSATQRPLEEIAAFLGGTTEHGPRPVTIVDAGIRKELEISVVVPIEDMSDLSTVPPEPGTPMLGEAQTRRSIWPAVHPKLLELVLAHRTTLIFANARRLAERLAQRLNEMAGEDIAKAHHGSLAREQRTIIEDDLKAGRLRAIVATSSLELGIDMGSVDLVVQVESPGSVARGIQRIGRAGHQVGEPSRGVFFPKFRGDLLEMAVVVQRMRDGEIEHTRYLRNPLDVLAQQIVAMCSVDEWRDADLLALARRSAPFANLGEETFKAVLDLLSGRYPSEEFSGLRQRIVWDRRSGMLRAREGAKRIAVTSGGTIPDRGLYGVFTPDGGRVGELDEEMVYESRPGETFVLGASTWRIEDITPSKVMVTPAPGEPGKMPFWKGDRPGRPVELGRALGEFVRTVGSAKHPERVLRERGLDEWAASNLLRYLADQREATGAVPDDRTIVVERFRDELGDWRVCILSPFGARVHAPWAIAIEERLQRRLGMTVSCLWSDDGIVIRLGEAEEHVPLEDLLVPPEEIEELVLARLPATPLFGATFREAAARALLLPRKMPGSRTPLWQQRRRAADLLAVAARYPTFPILLEATREIVQDIFDVPSLRELLGEIRSRRIRIATAETQQSSPFAQSLLFNWIAVYMYEGDAPLAETRAAALSLDAGLLRELLGSEELRELIDSSALESLELELQRLDGARAPKDADTTHDLLRFVGDLSDAEMSARGVRREWVDELLAQRRAIVIGVAGEQRTIAAEDASRYRDALGCALPQGLPAAFTDPVEQPLRDLISRYARTHGPFHEADIAARLGVAADRVRGALSDLESEGRVLRGEFRPGGSRREWCDADVLRTLKRRSLAALRREIEPVDAATFGRFLPAWHGVGTHRRGADALVETIGALQGAPIPASILEDAVLRARVDGYRPADLDALCASGDLVWVGAGPLGPSDGRVALLFRDSVRLLAPPAPDEPPSEPVHDAIRGHLSARGASFWPEVLSASGVADEDVVLSALWDLVWAGEVTNDTMAPLRALRAGKRKAPRARPHPGRLRRAGPPAAAGRWSLVSALREPFANPTEIAHARALQLLDRHGVLTREAVRAENLPGGFAGIYPVLKTLEESGRARRGHFVAGLGAAQFALPGAVDRLRAVRESEAANVVVLAAADPAQPYGAALPWPDSPHRPARAAGAWVIMAGGEAAAYLERGGHSLIVFDPAAAAWIDGLVSLVKDGYLPSLAVSKIDGAPARESPHADALRSAGFADAYRGLTLRG